MNIEDDEYIKRYNQKENEDKMIDEMMQDKNNF